MVLHARAIGIEELEEYNAFVIVLAESEDEGWRLELQRALSFDDQDVELGMNTHCLCTGEGATHYGGVEAWALEGEELRLSLNAEAAETLDLPQAMLIRLETTPEKITALRPALQRVFSEA